MEFNPDLKAKLLRNQGVFDDVYGDKAGELASMKEWPKEWMGPNDEGWLEWYEKYEQGRRDKDDERQIKRHNSFKARHLAQFIKKPTPRRYYALRNWAIDGEKYLPKSKVKLLKKLIEKYNG
jgi:hypothetical protein